MRRLEDGAERRDGSRVGNFVQGDDDGDPLGVAGGGVRGRGRRERIGQRRCRRR